MTENEIIEKMYREKASKKEISKTTGLTIAVIQYRIYKTLELHLKYPRNNKYMINSRQVTSEMINRIIILTNWGYHCKEIAEDQGVTPTEVRRVIEENLCRIQKKV